MLYKKTQSHIAWLHFSILEYFQFQCERYRQFESSRCVSNANGDVGEYKCSDYHDRREGGGFDSTTRQCRSHQTHNKAYSWQILDRLVLYWVILWTNDSIKTYVFVVFMLVYKCEDYIARVCVCCLTTHNQRYPYKRGKLSDNTRCWLLWYIYNFWMLLAFSHRGIHRRFGSPNSIQRRLLGTWSCVSFTFVHECSLWNWRQCRNNGVLIL